jgi:hypothetical protein
MSLSATRENDFRAIARLTNEAARLNSAIRAQDGYRDCPRRVLEALVDVSDPGKFVFPQFADETAQEAA